MDIFDFAMQMEKDGEDYYRSLAERSKSEGMAAILNRLADDEVKHYDVFKKLKKQESADITDTEILKDSRNIFAGMKEKEENFDFDESEIDLYKKARKLEEKSEAFYLEKADETEDTKTKEILQRVAAEEKRHIFLIDCLIEFISRPQTWIENAEFYHLDDY